MHAAERARRLCRILKPLVHVSSAGFVSPNDCRVAECARIRAQARRDRSSSFSSAAQSLGFAGPVHGNRLPAALYSIISSLQYSSKASAEREEPTETVKERYDKILESVNMKKKKTVAPNAMSWSMIGNCKNREDIKLLSENLRRFIVKSSNSGEF